MVPIQSAARAASVALFAIMFSTACVSRATQELRPGSLFRDCARCPQMIIVPAGSAIAGGNTAETEREQLPAELAARELPAYRVTLARPLAVGRYEVTNSEYAAFIAATRRVEPAGCTVLDLKTNTWNFDARRTRSDPGFAQSGRNPAVCISWDDAHDYAAWLSALTGHRYRLPSEGEWEYAARAGTGTARFWGDSRGDACAEANVADLTLADELGVDRPDPAVYFVCRDGYAQTAPVGSFRPNAFGLYDVNGNVWEWTADCYNETLTGAAEDGAARGGDCTRHMDRGGSWVNSPKYLRTAARHKDVTGVRNTVLGFRVVRDLSAAAAPVPPSPPIDTLPRVAVTHFNFVSLRVADMDRAVRFYADALLMRERGRAQPDMQNYEVVMGYDDTPMGTGISLTYRHGATDPKGNGSSSVNLVVTNLARIIDHVVPLGGRIIAPLQRVDGPTVSYSSARIEDPDSNALELIEYHRIEMR